MGKSTKMEWATGQSGFSAPAQQVQPGSRRAKALELQTVGFRILATAQVFQHGGTGEFHVWSSWVRILDGSVPEKVDPMLWSNVQASCIVSLGTWKWRIQTFFGSQENHPGSLQTRTEVSSLLIRLDRSSCIPPIATGLPQCVTYPRGHDWFVLRMGRHRILQGTIWDTSHVVTALSALPSGTVASKIAEYLCKAFQGWNSDGFCDG